MSNRVKKRHSILDIIFDSFNYIFITAFSIMCVYPFYYIFIYSISLPKEAAKGNMYLWPKGFSLTGYIDLLKLSNISQAALISVSRTIIGTALTVVCCALFAYILQHPKLRFRKIIYRFSIMTMYLGAGLIPYYVLMTKLHLKDNFLLYVIPSAIGMFNVILIKTYIESMPKELEESADIDGAGPMTVFLRIIFPLSTPIIATVAIFSAVGQWNTWQDNMYLVSSPKLQTLQLVLLNYLNDSTANLMALKGNSNSANQNITISQTTPTTIRMTITMIVTMPILFVYPFFQRFFVGGIMIGAVKG